MLDSSRKGYAVTDKELSGYSFESENYEDCKRWCRNDNVNVERIPVVNGFRLYVFFGKFWKPLYLRTRAIRNILWIHWSSQKAYAHKTGQIVYRSENETI